MSRRRDPKVARKLAVCGVLNAGKAAQLDALGVQADRVRALVWARFSGAKKRTCRNGRYAIG